MKKVLVLVVLFVLLVGVLPASAEAEANSEISDFESKLAELLSTSQNVEIGLLLHFPETLGLTFCVYADYSGFGDLGPCLSFTITDETEIWIDGKMSPGNIDDLRTGHPTVAVEYYHQDGLAYARRMFATNRMRTDFGSVKDIDYDNRIISWRDYRDPLYVPNQALITFHWDDNLHDLDELLVSDTFRVLIYEHDNLPFYIGPIIHVRYRFEINEHPIDTANESFYIFAPIVIGNK